MFLEGKVRQVGKARQAQQGSSSPASQVGFVRWCGCGWVLVVVGWCVVAAGMEATPSERVDNWRACWFERQGTSSEVAASGPATGANGTAAGGSREGCPSCLVLVVPEELGEGASRPGRQMEVIFTTAKQE